MRHAGCRCQKTACFTSEAILGCVDDGITVTLPTALRDQRTKSAYIFGAICPARGVGAGLVLPRCNTQAMQWHLDEISALVTPGAQRRLDEHPEKMRQRRENG